MAEARPVRPPLITIRDISQLRNSLVERMIQLGVSDIPLVMRAMDFAEHAQLSPRRGTELVPEAPAMSHIYRVMHRLVDAGYSSPSTLAIAALHDVIEDSPSGPGKITSVVIREFFGERIADGVVALSRYTE